MIYISRLSRPAGLWCVLAFLVPVASCGSDRAVGLSADSPKDSVTTPGADSLNSVDSLKSVPVAAARSGIPFGPFGLWKDYTSIQASQAETKATLNGQSAGLFNASITYTDAYGIVQAIDAARALRQKLVLAMTGGKHSSYMEKGKFDIWKWKARMNTYKTPAIRAAVAAGVADGTILGNTVMDEPEVWGSVTKPLINQMAVYVKSIFPTLPVGVDHGPNGYYQWQPTERYPALDYVMNQYNWWVTTGNVVDWRDNVLAQARRDGVNVVFGLNVLGGGIHNWQTQTCPIPLTGGKGPFVPTCRMTANQLRDWGLALGQYGCGLFLWEYDPAFMSNPANQQAFKDLAAKLAATPAPSCRRS